MKEKWSSRGTGRVAAFLIGGMLAAACANIGTPNGGPYDEAPPRFVSSTPLPNQTRYQGKRVDILFDELIQIDQPSENVIITPPQRELPIIRAAGKRVVVQLEDSLLPNTTYTIDFTNSIADNNEKNIYENFTFAFSTGETIDSLQLAGILLNAENLEPMPGMTVGVHLNPADSAFRTLPFDRTSRTDDRGRFTIRNMAPGSYRLYALHDVNRDYMFDQPGEEIAFCDTLLTPTFELTTRQDTVWKDSLTIDTVRTVPYTRFLPDDLELRLFKEKFERQYMLRPERIDSVRFTLRFNAPLDTFPVPRPLNFEPADSVWYFLQPEAGGTGAIYWLTDPAAYRQDTLRLEVSYLKSDSLNIQRPQTDTLSLAAKRRPAAEKKKRKGDEPEPIDFLPMTVSASGTINLFDTVAITFGEPLRTLTKESIYLDRKVDTLWQAIDFEFERDSANPLRYLVKRPWRYGEEYHLEIDSATIFSRYGKWNTFYGGDFKIKNEDEYGHLYLNLPGVDSCAFVELLNGSDAPVRKAAVKEGGVLFMDLKPDKYYARLVVDRNGNGRWDTGNFAERLQPETVYYCPKVFNVMQNWQVEESWDIHATPPERQKPLEITKNKPKELTKKKRDYRNENRQNSSRSSGNALGGLGL